MTQSAASRMILAAMVGLSAMLHVSVSQAADASIKLEIFRAGFIVGVGGGSGTLVYDGKGYPLRVGGVSLGATIGASSAELIGEVTGLTRPEDIEGTYTAVGGSAVLAGGGSAAELRNSKGVQLRVRGRSIGLELSLDLSGLKISLR